MRWLLRALTQHRDEGRGGRRLPEPIAGGAGVLPSIIRGRLLEQEAPVHQHTDPSPEMAAGDGEEMSELPTTLSSSPSVPALRYLRWKTLVLPWNQV